ncbi:hypothetical protein ACC760_39325, partial [Rhizobium ruizarguesonis]
AMQILEGDGDVNTRYGQRSFSMLLFQDLAILPLLALITILDGGDKCNNAPHLPEAGGFQLQYDDEEQEDDAEFGDIEDLF